MAETKTTESNPAVILFGDSLTAWSFNQRHRKGLGDVLTEHFEGEVKVFNDGMFSISMDTEANA
jgi:lysophospholipase L1-like esterase